MLLTKPWGTESVHTLPNCPLVAKQIDAREPLSIQVHPKSAETWYVLRASPGAIIYAGLKPNATRFDLLNDPVQSLHAVPVLRGDVLTIPAGTPHAIGAGVTILEVKESDDVTYRIYDWGRDRELHVEQALSCIDFERDPIFPVRFL